MVTAMTTCAASSPSRIDTNCSLEAGSAVRADVSGRAHHSAAHCAGLASGFFEIGLAEIPEGLAGQGQLLALLLDHGSSLGLKVDSTVENTLSLLARLSFAGRFSLDGLDHLRDAGPEQEASLDGTAGNGDEGLP